MSTRSDDGGDLTDVSSGSCVVISTNRILVHALRVALGRAGGLRVERSDGE